MELPSGYHRPCDGLRKQEEICGTIRGMSRLLLAILAFASSAFPQSPSPDELGKIFAGFQGKESPGCAAAVDAPAHEPWSGAYGMADLEHGIRNTSSTVFEVG